MTSPTPRAVVGVPVVELESRLERARHQAHLGLKLSHVLAASH